MKSIPRSELIINPDGSIYHLNLKPDDIANTIITVGDPDRIDQVVKYFDKVYLTKQKREFKTVTGKLGGKDITVISTGIGTDNIDIVLNELDALVNIDFKTRTIKDTLTKLNLIRIGTSGILQADIPLDSLLISRYAIGFDRLLDHYQIKTDKMIRQLSGHYIMSCSIDLFEHFKSDMFLEGITLTANGFYGPQGRNIRLQSATDQTIKKVIAYQEDTFRVTNLEMETAGIYGIGYLLGHECISLNALLANRATGTFSDNPRQTIDTLIQESLKIIEEL